MAQLRIKYACNVCGDVFSVPVATKVLAAVEPAMVEGEVVRPRIPPRFSFGVYDCLACPGCGHNAYVSADQ